MSEKLTPCKVCEEPAVSAGDFCSKKCEDFHENATFVCHLCSAIVEHKFEEQHKGRPCLENQMDKVREEIEVWGKELQRLQREWEEKK